MEYPSWPLGTTFGDRTGRRFEVRHVIMGNPEEGMSWEVETPDGWRITSQACNCKQSKVGFVELGKDNAGLIYESVANLDEFVKNRHLIRL